MKIESMIGEELSVEIVVTEDDTAKSFGSGSIDVYATPKMVGLMENAALSLAQRGLDEGFSTVGTKVEVKHLAATPVGMKVTGKAKLVEVDRRRLLFEVEAFDEAEKIGEGIHERFIVDVEKFLGKTKNKGN
ncbi:thioesterase family protein [Alkalibacter saccharofermentans]|jgi:predicted thioesterase|uniref:Thioesterase superfamily n=1 Tax=Alkalibacter saccharofermentans DSM 14828 TaxID=1120975 RepID=A0A1M4YF84_9FIRM|nr:thioesterase family protein [Alkalibacter saccharofermentans]SHF04283.1 Thioesterase superfamily [Alkalibacter saccharofermentans DSM 14828]